MEGAYNSDRYRYSVLPTTTCFRLISLRRTSEVEPSSSPAFGIHIFELGDSPPFDALSYTWGDPRCPLVDLHPEEASVDYEAATHVALCDGFVFPLRKNLHDVLLRLHSLALTPMGRSRSEYIWIDAICINQSDLAERSSQVLQMGDLYQRAESVIAWLGCEDQTTEPSLAILRQLAPFGFIPTSWDEAREMRDNIAWITVDDFYSDASYEEKIGSHRPSTHEWLAFASFLQLPYFNRAWIVQELAIAKGITMVWGRHVVDFDDFVRVAWFMLSTNWFEHLLPGYLKRRMIGSDPGPFSRILYSKKSPFLSLIPLVQTRCQIKYADVIYQHLPTLLRVHRPCDATDPRDKIYAFLSIANKTPDYFTDPQRARYLTPDYTTPVQRLYTSVTRLLIMEKQGLQAVLNRPSTALVNCPLSPILPSWVPDYTAPVIPDALHVGATCNWLACGEHLWSPDGRPVDDPLLGVKGILVGEICHRSIPYMSSAGGNSLHERWASMAPLLSEIDLYYLPLPDPSFRSEYMMNNLQGRMEVFCRTLLADTLNREHPADIATLAPQFLAELSYIILLGMAEHSSIFTGHEGFHERLGALLQVPNEKFVVPWVHLLDAEPGSSPFNSTAFLQKLQHVVTTMEDHDPNEEDLSLFLSWKSDLCADFRRDAQDQQRVLFRTQNGLLGMGPLELEVGDVVWVLAGAKTPVVLRKRVSGNWAVVGETYLHGVMHGEATDWGRPFQDLDLE